MPIKPENRARYPADWKAIRERILLRAANCCEKCKAPEWRRRVDEAFKGAENL